MGLMIGIIIESNEKIYLLCICYCVYRFIVSIYNRLIKNNNYYYLIKNIYMNSITIFLC